MRKDYYVGASVSVSVSVRVRACVETASQKSEGGNGGSVERVCMCSPAPDGVSVRACVALLTLCAPLLTSGNGALATVSLVKRLVDGSYFALKRMDKKKVRVCAHSALDAPADDAGASDYSSARDIGCMTETRRRDTLEIHNPIQHHARMPTAGGNPKLD